MRIAVVTLVVVALASACDGGDAQPSTSLAAVSTTMTSTTTTTTTTLDITRACEVLGEETVEWLGSTVDALDAAPAVIETDPATWPAEVSDLVGRGRELDARATELGCDPGTIQAGVLAEAAVMRAEGRSGAFLLLLLRISQAG